MTKPVSTTKNPRKQHTSEFCQEALKLAERIGVAAAAARELSPYESQLYAWHSKLKNAHSSSEQEQEMSVEIARLKRQLAERDEDLAILQKAATYFAKRLNEVCLHRKSSGRVQHQSDMSCASGLPAAAGMSGAYDATR
jgi:Transposase.